MKETNGSRAREGGDRERLERLHGEHPRGLAHRLLAIGKDCAGRLKEPLRSAEHGALLYDERGLPR